jgi:hypothetical protein
MSAPCAQVFAGIGTRPPWLDDVDPQWRTWELPDETPDTSGQGVEQPTDVRFGDQWVRFDSEAQADFVRTLAASRTAPRKLAIPADRDSPHRQPGGRDVYRGQAA